MDSKILCILILDISLICQESVAHKITKQSKPFGEAFVNECMEPADILCPESKSQFGEN